MSARYRVGDLAFKSETFRGTAIRIELPEIELIAQVVPQAKLWAAKEHVDIEGFAAGTKDGKSRVRVFARDANKRVRSKASDIAA